VQTIVRVLISGSLASIGAALTLAAASKREGRAAAVPLNATSHWLHGDSAADYEGVDWQHTGVGYATHHSAAIFWAGLFELLRQYSSRSDLAAVVRDAMIASTCAATVDYTVSRQDGSWRFQGGQWRSLMARWLRHSCYRKCCSAAQGRQRISKPNHSLNARPQVAEAAIPLSA
jgi:hypothetical protein